MLYVACNYVLLFDVILITCQFPNFNIGKVNLCQLLELELENDLLV